MRDRLILVDAKNFCARMHYTHMTLSSAGRPTSVLYGGLDGLLSLKRKVPGDIVFVWDGDGDTWRHKALKGEYKANRKHRKNPDWQKYQQQLPIFRSILKTCQFPQFILPNMEGDDLLSILLYEALNRNWYKEIVVNSTDRDFNQLLQIDRVKLLRRFEDGRPIWCRPRDVQEEYGVSPREWVRFRTLWGDRGDNILPPVRGIGPATALKMLHAGVNPDFGYPSTKVAKAYPKLAKAWSRVCLNRRLVTLPDRDYMMGNPNVPMDLKGKLIMLLDNLEPDDFIRGGKKYPLTDLKYQRFLRFAADYDMVEIIARRFKLWSV